MDIRKGNYPDGDDQLFLSRDCLPNWIFRSKPLKSYFHKTDSAKSIFLQEKCPER
jgi:hypothetical protein